MKHLNNLEKDPSANRSALAIPCILVVEDDDDLRDHYPLNKKGKHNEVQISDNEDDSPDQCDDFLPTDNDDGFLKL